MTPELFLPLLVPYEDRMQNVTGLSRHLVYKGLTCRMYILVKYLLLLATS